MLIARIRGGVPEIAAGLFEPSVAVIGCASACARKLFCIRGGGDGGDGGGDSSVLGARGVPQAIGLLWVGSSLGSVVTVNFVGLTRFRLALPSSRESGLLFFGDCCWPGVKPPVPTSSSESAPSLSPLLLPLLLALLSRCTSRTESTGTRMAGTRKGVRGSASHVDAPTGRPLSERIVLRLPPCTASTSSDDRTVERHRELPVASNALTVGYV